MTDLHEEYMLTVRGYRRQGIECFIHDSVILAADVKVWHYARVLQGAQLGLGCSIGGGTEIGRGSIIGAHARIGANCFLPPNSIIGTRVFIGPSVTFCDDRHPYVHGPDDPDYTAEPPVVEDEAVIGAGAVILPGVRIGARAIVAAGALVTRDVPARACVMSRPAKLHNLSVESAEKLKVAV